MIMLNSLLESFEYLDGSLTTGRNNIKYEKVTSKLINREFRKEDEADS